MTLFKKLFSKDTGVAFKASFWYTFCNFLQKGISFFVVPLYVRLLTTAEYGQYTVFSSWLSLLIILASLNLYCGVYTKAMVDLNEERDKYTSSMQGLGTVTTGIFLIAYLFNTQFWNNTFKINTLVGISMFVYFLTYPSVSFWMTRQRVDFKYKKVVFATLVMSILYPIISVILIKTTNLKPKAIMLGYLWSQSFFGLFFYVYYFIKGKVFFNKQYWIKALKFNIPLLPHYISLVILSQTDRLMVQFYCGDSEAGIYGFACQIGTILSVVGNAICSSFVPWIYQKLKDLDIESIKKTSFYLSFFMCFCCVAMIALVPEGIRILGTSDYEKSKYIIPIIAGGYFFAFCYSFFASVEFYYSSTKSVMIATTLSAIINIGLNALLLPLLGSIAAALTTLFCDLCLCIFHYIASRKVLKKQGIPDSPFNISHLLFISLFALIIGFVFVLLYDDAKARISAVASILIFCFAAKDKIKGIFRGLKDEKKG